MKSKFRNWILIAAGIATFILVTPFVQQTIVGAMTPEQSEQKTAHPEMQRAHVPVVRVGDYFLRLVPAKDASIGALLYDSSLKPVAFNDNEAELSFVLPGGERTTIKITKPASVAHDKAGAHHAAGNDTCCAPEEGGMQHAVCPHEAEGQTNPGDGTGHVTQPGMHHETYPSHTEQTQQE